MVFKQVDYGQLNSRQQENYNFHKVAARMAGYGFNCLRLTDDWQGADFIACHIDGQTFLKVQLKGRLCLDKKYIGKNIHIAFRSSDDWFLYPHDDVVAFIEAQGKIDNSRSWKDHRSYSWAYPPRWIKQKLQEYRL